MVLYAQLSTEIPELVAVKLSSVIRDNHPREPKPIDDVLPKEMLYFGLYDYC